MNIPAIDVLRGVAALGVAWFHSRVDLWVGFREIQANPDQYSWFDRWISWVSLPVSQLGSLVMLFFVLSGLCIHLPMAKGDRSFVWSSYLTRRGMRIYPAYFAVVLLCAAGWFVLDSCVRFGWETYGYSLLLLQNWALAGQQIVANPSLWSIPVEVELYLVYPLLLWLHRRWRLRGAMMLTVVCFLIGFGLHVWAPAFAMGTFFKYAVIWNSGAWLADAFVSKTLPRWTVWRTTGLVVASLGTPLAGLSGLDLFYLHYGWGLASFLGLRWLITDGDRFVHSDVRWVRATAAVGTISYSVYLIHFPLFKLAGIGWVNVYGEKPASFLVPTVATLLTIPLAWVFYQAFERPTHQLARRWGKPRAAVEA